MSKKTLIIKNTKKQVFTSESRQIFAIWLFAYIALNSFQVTLVPNTRWLFLERAWFDLYKEHLDDENLIFFDNFHDFLNAVESVFMNCDKFIFIHKMFTDKIEPKADPVFEWDEAFCEFLSNRQMWYFDNLENSAIFHRKDFGSHFTNLRTIWVFDETRENLDDVLDPNLFSLFD